MICYRRPSRPALCRYCGLRVETGEIALSSWLKYGWSYTHIKCALKESKIYHCKTQPAVTMKEAIRATRQAVTDLMVERMTGGKKDD